jgi:hypothetical protein
LINGGKMNVNDLHHASKAFVAFKSQAIASDTTTVGETIDLASYEAAEFVFLTKTVTDGDYAVDLYESDDSGMAGETLVSAEEMLGDISFADDTDDDAIARVGYIGKKRYIRAKVVSINTTTGVDIISGVCLLAFGQHQPVADQNG